MGGEWDGPKPACFGLNQENDYSMEKPPTILFRHELGPIAQSNDGKLIVYPGTILHMECLWIRRFGVPKWTVSHDFRCSLLIFLLYNKIIVLLFMKGNTLKVGQLMMVATRLWSIDCPSTMQLKKILGFIRVLRQQDTRILWRLLLKVKELMDN